MGETNYRGMQSPSRDFSLSAWIQLTLVLLSSFQSQVCPPPSPSPTRHPISWSFIFHHQYIYTLYISLLFLQTSPSSQFFFLSCLLFIQLHYIVIFFFWFYIKMYYVTKAAVYKFYLIIFISIEKEKKKWDYIFWSWFYFTV